MWRGESYFCCVVVCFVVFGDCFYVVGVGECVCGDLWGGVLYFGWCVCDGLVCDWYWGFWDYCVFLVLVGVFYCVGVGVYCGLWGCVVWCL